MDRSGANMKDITGEAMDTLMKYAPVWAASMAGRTKVFISEETPTAHASGSNGRFKIVINPKLKGDMPFILMHEVAHIFREDIQSMRKNPAIGKEINVAADCIINDSLKAMKIPMTNDIRKMACWGQDFYQRDCSKMSINSLMKIKQSESASVSPSEPGAVTPGGQSAEDEGRGGEDETEGTETGGVGDDLSGYVGLGDNTMFGDPKQLAHSVVAYARRMFFEAGFKSKNMSTKYDWRRNRSAFATRTDVVIPRTTVGEYGHNTEGPLVNLVLDVSGSMHSSWVSTASVIAREIGKAGLDYDLWLTPSRRKARNPEAVLDALEKGVWIGDMNDVLHDISNHGKRLDERVRPHTSRDKPIEKIGHGANELREIVYFHTEDPVVWIYVGDYCSSIDYELFLDKNFLHIPMVDGGSSSNRLWTNDVFDEMKRRSLPRWFYSA